MEETKYISRVQMANGVVYELKDSEAREALSNLGLLDGILILNCGTSTEVVGEEEG